MVTNSNIEDELNRLIQENKPDLYSRLQTKSGIAKSTAIHLIVLSDGFRKFKNAKQFTCFVGLSPAESRSATCIWGKSRISKQGNGELRNLLFLCSFNACKSNKSCKELYERLTTKGKGKSKKLALIAVANKLSKQSLAVAKSGLVYDQDYVSNNSVAN